MKNDLTIEDLEVFSLSSDPAEDTHLKESLIGEKKFKKALVVGRFQPLHRGHIYLFKCALQVSKLLIIAIGSPNAKDEDNPFSLEMREKLLRRAFNGYEGLSMRTLAEKVKIVPSVLYYYFKDKDTLLKAMFDEINTDLGKKRVALPKARTASDMLKQRIEFQLDHAEEIVAVLKFYLTYRNNFNKLPLGYVPDKAYLHIEEVLNYGVKTGAFADIEIKEQAKVITHAINGFILEYYPTIPKGREKRKLIESIHKFLWRAIKKGGDTK